MELLSLGMQKCKTDVSRTIIQLSDEFIKFIGYTQKEINDIFKNEFINLLPPEELELYRIKYKQLAELHKNYELNYPIITHDGTQKFIYEQGIFSTEDDMDFIYINLFNSPQYININSYYKDSLNSLPNAVFITNLNMEIIFANDICLNLFNTDKDSCYGLPCSILNSPYCNNEQCCIKRMTKGEDNTTYVEDFNGRSYRVHVSYILDQLGNKIGYSNTSVDITELKMVERQLQIRDQMFRIALPHITSGIWEYDSFTKTLIRASGRHEDFNFHSVTKNVPESLIKAGVVHFDSIDDLRRIFNDLDSGAKEVFCEIKLINNNGDICWFHLAFSSIFDDNNNLIKTVGVTSDITAKKELEMQLLQEKQYLDSLIAGSISVYEVNLTKNKVENSTTQNIPTKIGKNIVCSLLLSGHNWIVHPDDAELVKKRFSTAELLQAFHSEQNKVQYDYRHIENKKQYWVSSTVNLIRTVKNGDIYALVQIKNINKQKEQEQELHKNATRDFLTNLYNRAFASSKVTEFLSSLCKNKIHAMFLIDIDNFKSVNDAFGHLYGDQFLIEVADTLTQTFGQKNVICRLGGDEFFVFIDHIEKDAAMKKSQEFCEKITTISSGKLPNVSVSIGIAFVEGEVVTFNELYRRSDYALYSAKEQGKNRYMIYGL